jgi:hypothetical protein
VWRTEPCSTSGIMLKASQGIVNWRNIAITLIDRQSKRVMAWLQQLRSVRPEDRNHFASFV